MSGFFGNLMDWLCGHHQTEPIEAEPTEQSRWIVDIPPRDAIRLGTFQTKQEAYDARREFIIRTIEENEPVEVQP